MRKGVIFDLYQTLLDTSSLEKFRATRNWSKVYENIPNLICDPYIIEILSYLKINNILLGVVTNSPRPYFTKIVKNFGINVDMSICFHDVIYIKPNPEGYNKLIKKLMLEREFTIAVGDKPEDIMAAKGAKIMSIGYSMYCKDNESLISAKPDFIANDHIELRSILTKFFNL